MSGLQLPENFFRAESARLVGMLISRFGPHRLQFAEDVAQEALVRALQTWPYRGQPENPSAWLTRAAKNVATDLLRREQRWRSKEPDIATEHERWLAVTIDDSPEEGIGDDSLQMIFVCFHPQLSSEAQTALALRTICGLSPAEIAAAFLTSEAAISKRLVRARQRIREMSLAFEVPEGRALTDRLEGVLGTLYLMFNEGYKASCGKLLVRGELCQEAIRMVGLLAENSTTRTPRVLALLALMLLNGARLNTRVDDAGLLLRLAEQDRSAWDRSMIERGIRCLSLAGAGHEVTPYHLEAGIAACHCLAETSESTDWRRILTLYDQLLILADSPLTRLNRGVALGRVEGPAAGLDALAEVPLDSHYLLHAVRGALEAERENVVEALAHFHKARTLAPLQSEREFLSRRILECGGGIR